MAGGIVNVVKVLNTEHMKEKCKHIHKPVQSFCTWISNRNFDFISWTRNKSKPLKKKVSHTLSTRIYPNPTMIKFELLILELRLLLKFKKKLFVRENKLTGKFNGKSMSSII